MNSSLAATDNIDACFGETLYALRCAAGLSQAELARRSGLSRSYVSEVENSKRPAPKVQTVHRITSALGLDEGGAASLISLAVREYRLVQRDSALALCALLADIGALVHRLSPRDIRRVHQQLKEMAT